MPRTSASRVSVCVIVSALAPAAIGTNKIAMAIPRSTKPRRLLRRNIGSGATLEDHDGRCLKLCDHRGFHEKSAVSHAAISDDSLEILSFASIEDCEDTLRRFLVLCQNGQRDAQAVEVIGQGSVCRQANEYEISVTQHAR